MIIHYIIHKPLTIQGSGLGVVFGSLNRIKKLAELGNNITTFSPTKKNRADSIQNVQTVNIPTLDIKYINMFLFQLFLAFRLIIFYINPLNRPDAIIIRHHPLNFGFIPPALLFKIPFFLEIHSDLVEELKLDRRANIIPQSYFTFFRKYEKYIFQKARGIMINHIALKRFFVQAYKISPEKIKVIPNGSDIDFFKPMPTSEARKILKLNQNKKRLLFVGNISKWHGVDYVIRAIPYLKKLRTDFIIDIVGKEGEFGPEIKLTEIVDKLNVREYVNFVGPVPRNQACLWIASANLCLLPAKMVRKHPGSPVKLFDYIAMGKPVLAANVESYGDFVEENQLGVCVDYTTPQEVASKMDCLLNTELSFYAVHNRFLAETKFSWYHRAISIYEFIKAQTEPRPGDVKHLFAD